jgi:tetratricopeptide (TPR) repeat protein
MREALDKRVSVAAGATQHRMLVAAAAGLLLMTGSARARDTGTDQGVPEPSPAATKQDSESYTETWLRRQIRRFRSYPHLDRAYQLLQAGKQRDAVNELQNYLRLEPDDLSARASYLVLLYQLGDDAQTISEANLVLQKQPDTESALLYRALAEQRQGQIAAASQDFHRAALNPAASRDDRLFAANSLVEIAVQRGSFAEAEAGLNLVARDTDDFQLHFRRGRTLEALGRLPEADASYQNAIQRAGTDAERFEALAAAGFLALRRGQLQEASATLRAAHDLEKSNVEVLHGLADVSMRQHDFTAASDWLRAALAIKPSRRDQAEVARLALVRSDWPLAIELYSSLLTDADTPEERYQILSSLASAYRASARPEDAEAAWRKALAIRETADGQRQLAYLLEAQGKLAEAAIALERSVVLQPTAEGQTQLSMLYAKLKDPTQAIRHARDALAIADSAQLHQNLGYLYLNAGDLHEADQEFEKAAAAGKAGPLHMQRADIYAKLGDEHRELEQLELAVGGELDPADRQRAERQLAYLYARFGMEEQRIEALRAAVGAGLDDAEIHMDLGFALMSRGDWYGALDEFLRSNERQASPRALYYVAQCYRELHQDGIRLSYLLLAERSVESMDTESRIALYNDLGYAQELQGNSLAAAAAWSKSIQLRYDATIALRLALAEFRMGQFDEAERLLVAIPPASLTTARRVARAETIGEIAEKKGNLAAAHTALAEADELEPTAERAYQMGLLAQRERRYDQAIHDFELALQRDPNSALYARTLAYAYQHVGDQVRAEALLKNVVARTPGDVSVYRNLAYAQSAAGLQTEAASSLRTAIDLERSAPPAESGGTNSDNDLDAMRQEYGSLARRFGATLYESYRPNGGSVVPQSQGGLIPSQGGLEGFWYPAGMLGRSDDPLQFGARLLWSNNPHSLSIDDSSLQGGVSVRYKPLQSANLFLGAERLLKIGADSQSDWLLRGSFGLGHDVEIRPGKTFWNYSQLYVDLGHFTQPAVNAVYAEVHEGLTFRAGPQFVITPHLVLVDHHQNPDPAQESIVEGGPGVSFKYFFPAATYRPYWSTLNFLVQYRERLSGDGHSGWVLSLVFQL